jgi:hypothetical protein
MPRNVAEPAALVGAAKKVAAVCEPNDAGDGALHVNVPDVSVAVSTAPMLVVVAGNVRVKGDPVIEAGG